MTQTGLTAWRTAVLAVAGVTGAAGVALAAVAAHKVQSPALGSASTILLVHAPAAVAIAANAASASRPLPWIAVASVMLLAALVFALDVTLLTLTGERLFPLAAPIGGTSLIVSWLGLAGVAILERR